MKNIKNATSANKIPTFLQSQYETTTNEPQKMSNIHAKPIPLKVPKRVLDIETMTWSKPSTLRTQKWIQSTPPGGTKTSRLYLSPLPATSSRTFLPAYLWRRHSPPCLFPVVHLVGVCDYSLWRFLLNYNYSHESNALDDDASFSRL